MQDPEGGEPTVAAEVVWNSSAFLVSYVPARAGAHNLTVGLVSTAGMVHITGSPFPLLVLSSTNLSVVHSVAQGFGLTLATSGLPAGFTIVARDQFNGALQSDVGRFGLFVASNQAITCNISSHVASGTYSVAYILTLAGVYTMSVCVADQSGLVGDYYGDTGFQALLFSRQDRMIDFVWPRGRPGSDLLGGDWNAGRSFAIRWTGFVHSTLEQTHTFGTELGGPNERVKLWVDQSIIIDQVLC